MGKTVDIFGRNFYDCTDLIVRVERLGDLHHLLHETLVQQKPRPPEEHVTKLKKVLFSYLEGLIPYVPIPAMPEHYGSALLDEVTQSALRARQSRSPS